MNIFPKIFQSFAKPDCLLLQRFLGSELDYKHALHVSMVMERSSGMLCVHNEQHTEVLLELNCSLVGCPSATGTLAAPKLRSKFLTENQKCVSLRAVSVPEWLMPV